MESSQEHNRAAARCSLARGGVNVAAAQTVAAIYDMKAENRDVMS
jgi:hypothetical protein